MTFTPIKLVLPQVTRTLSLDRQAIAGMVCESYRKQAAAIVHPEVLTHSSPKHFRNGTLTIAVHNAPWAQVIQWKKYALKNSLNAQLPSPFIREIKIVIDIAQHPQTSIDLSL